MQNRNQNKHGGTKQFQGQAMQGQMQQANPYINQGAQANNANPYMNQGAMGQNNPYMQNQTSGISSKEILTGALIGAAATYVLTNENVQKTLFKGMVGIGDVISGGLDELKERFEDAKAEYEASKEA